MVGVIIVYVSSSQRNYKVQDTRDFYVCIVKLRDGSLPNMSNPSNRADVFVVLNYVLNNDFLNKHFLKLIEYVRYTNNIQPLYFSLVLYNLRLYFHVWYFTSS